MMEFKCKLKDFVDDCVSLDITEITMDVSGIGLAVADSLRNKGIYVCEKRRQIKSFSEDK